MCIDYLITEKVREFGSDKEIDLKDGIDVVIRSDDIWIASDTCSCNLSSNPKAMEYFDKKVLEALHEWLKSGRYSKFVIHPV